MRLTFSKEALEEFDKFTLIANDIVSGTSVNVRISREALQDFGIDSARQVAEAKYAAGLFEPDGSVFVRTNDLNANRT